MATIRWNGRSKKNSIVAAPTWQGLLVIASPIWLLALGQLIVSALP